MDELKNLDPNGYPPFKLNAFDPKRSHFIEASAGTGKTYTIQLIVSKLISEGTPLKKILIVTYTEKAAGELKDRIRKKINEVLESKQIVKDDKTEQELSQEALSLFAKASQDVDNAAIFTIHSFCQKALKEYAYDAGRPFDMAMIDDSQVVGLVEQYVRDVWINDAKFKQLLKNDTTEKLIEKIKGTLTGAINNYKGNNKAGEIIPLDAATLPEIAGTPLSLEILEKIAHVETFEDLKVIPHFEEELKFFEDIIENEERAKNFVNEIRSWSKKGKPLFDGRTFQARYFSEDLRDHFNVLKSIKDFLPKAGAILIAARYEDFIVKQIPIVFDKWQRFKKDDKCQSFNDMILSVHKAVTEGNNLKEKLRQQFKYAIIDEFQDTNKLQWDIFSTIFLNAQDHSIFVVGDPKQSIYSFQGADVNVYKAAIDQIHSGFSLDTNFRSTAGIIKGCNELFKGCFFTPAEGSPELVKFKDSNAPAIENQQKVPPTVDGNEVAPIWISEDNISSLNFARTAVAKIVDWCSFKNGRTRLQVFDKKDCRKYRNVTFRDFAVLARSRTEMEEMEDSMRNAGVPFTRYKDNNLFNSRECAEWVALFRALNANDFSAWNRRLLSEVLITDFFKTVFTKNGEDTSGDRNMDELHYVDSKTFDDPNNHERKLLNAWRDLALKHRYAEMLERIYSDTQIEQRLMDISKLQNLARLRQIGNYAVEYLYSHNCSLEDLVRHLEGLTTHRENTDDEDGNLVEKGTDYDAVQVMTIHASKGLEFPVVISVAGFKGRSTNNKGPFLYHGEDGIHLGLNDAAKKAREEEEQEEWKRLFYVDFTRASSILILPRYEKWQKKDKKGNTSIKPEFQFLYNSHNEFCKNVAPVGNEGAQTLTVPSYTIMKTDSDWTIREKKEQVKNDILLPLSTGESTPETVQEVEENIQIQKTAMESLQKQVPQACIMQYSYSSLSGKADSGISNEDGSRQDQNGLDRDSENSETNSRNKVSIKSIDVNAVNCSMARDEAQDYQSNYGETAKKFPRGSKLGNAIHKVFERAKFLEIGKTLPTLESALKDTQSQNVVEEEFRNEALPIWNHKEDWTPIAIGYLWNTLNAKLPTICGNATTSETFSLTEIPLTDHKPEMQFNLNAHDIGNSDANDPVAHLHKFCKGFIDLMFVRTDKEGNKRYSILDWKSDVLEENRYTPDALKERVDADYSIQRVLYSYCLIQWLKQFYGEGTAENLTEEEIFQKHFGGIYYAFVRGTLGGTGRGIYAQTWNSYDDLKNAYGEIKKLMNK